jgi:hypothetical protein
VAIFVLKYAIERLYHLTFLVLSAFGKFLNKEFTLNFSALRLCEQGEKLRFAVGEIKMSSSMSNDLKPVKGFMIEQEQAN